MFKRKESKRALKKKKAKFIEAHRELLVSYWKEEYIECPLCNIDKLETCQSCTQQYGFFRCHDMFTFATRSPYPMYRARYHKRVIKVLKSLPLERFTKESVSEVGFKELFVIDRKINSERKYEAKKT